jgi:hypothetical protein
MKMMRKLTIDYLAMIDDVDLEKHSRRMKSIVKRTNGNQKSLAEIELCYVQREVAIRHARHASSHARHSTNLNKFDKKSI